MPRCRAEYAGNMWACLGNDCAAIQLSLNTNIANHLHIMRHNPDLQYHCCVTHQLPIVCRLNLVSRGSLVVKILYGLQCFVSSSHQQATHLAASQWASTLCICAAPSTQIETATPCINHNCKAISTLFAGHHSTSTGAAAQLSTKQ